VACREIGAVRSLLRAVAVHGFAGSHDAIRVRSPWTNQLTLRRRDVLRAQGGVCLSFSRHSYSAFCTKCQCQAVLQIFTLRNRFPSGGYSGRVDLSAEAIRLTRQLALACDEPEAAGLLALMLLHHARRAARTDEHGTLIALDKQARTRWNEAEIAEGVRILQAALARDRRGEYQIQGAIVALHDDARTAGETDWPQILAWYNELLELADNPVAALSRAVAVGEVDGPLAGLSAVEDLATRLGDHHRLDAARAHLDERAGHVGVAAEHYTRTGGPDA
jgi:predicted RNA polymerase sigma factor